MRQWFLKSVLSLTFFICITLGGILFWLFNSRTEVLSFSTSVRPSISSPIPANKQFPPKNHTTCQSVDNMTMEKELKFEMAIKSLQAERHSTLINHCQRTRGNFNFVKDRANPRPMYSSRYKYSVCDIFKCAYTNWLGFTLVAEGYYTVDDKIAGRVTGGKAINLGNKIRFNAFRNQTLAKQKWIDSFKIITVRNPFERIVSAYEDKMHRNSPGFTYIYGPISERINKSFRKMRQNVTERFMADDGTATFEDFVNFLVFSKEKIVNDYHWLLYDAICQPCVYEFDYIAKFETFQQDFGYLRSILNLTKEHESAFFPNKMRKTQPNITEKHFSGIPCKTSTKLYEKYKTDFDAFGYERPKWLC